jgi:hypothetical protein
MGERHIRVSEDYISCDWCKKELQGLKCTTGTDIEGIVIGNIQTKREHSSRIRSWYSSGYYPNQQLVLTGLEMDLCMDCKKKFFDHIQSFISAQFVENKEIGAD